MAKTYKVLGQAAPSATTETTVYTVPASTQSVLSSIVVCNRSSTPATYRIAVRPNGAAVANQHYIAYDAQLTANEVTALTLGVTVDAEDVISAYASTANVTFSVFGAEVA